MAEENRLKHQFDEYIKKKIFNEQSSIRKDDSDDHKLLGHKHNVKKVDIKLGHIINVDNQRERDESTYQCKKTGQC